MDEKLKCEGYWGPCENDGILTRQNTAYSDDKLNFRTYCPICQKEADEYWADRWAEVYGSRY